MRQTLQGLWIPRKDLTDWKIEFSDGQVYTREQPGPVDEAEIELDAIGCLSSGNIKLSRPRHPVFPAFRFTAKVWVESRVLGWVPVALGFIPPVNPEGDEEYTLELRRMEELNLDGYFDGSVVHDTLGPEAADWNETNRAVMDRALKRSPTASVGTDWNGRVILSRPEHGSPVWVSRDRFHAWKLRPDVVLPYLTESRWNGGPGWKRGEYHGIPRPPLTPRRAQDAGEVKFDEVTRPAGIPVVTARELTLQPAGEGAATPGLPELVLTEQAMKEPVARGKFSRRVKASQYAAVVVLDPQAWYEGSSLPGQDSQEVRALQEKLASAQATYALAVDTLGTDSSLTARELEALLTAQNDYRLGRAGQRDVQSDYEPLSAQLPLGFTAHDVAGGVLTGTTMWISRLPWDPKAVGAPAAVNPDPDAPLSEGEQIEGQAIVHPLASGDTIQVFETPMQEYTDNAEGKSWQTTSLKIPESYFRGPIGPALARKMDADWKASFDPEEPPADAVPPSRSWDGRWYLHVALWWQTTRQRSRAIRTDFTPLKGGQN